MSFEAWIIFAAFWALFVTTPGPNAANCIANGMSHGFLRALPGVGAILCQATLFLTLSALGVTALIASAPEAFRALQLTGAAFLIYLGIRTWRTARTPARVEERPGSAPIFWRAFAIATLNPKSVAGYLAAFSQFVQPGVPISAQMSIIAPTALTLTALSYMGFTALGAGLGRAALGAVFNAWLRRGLGVCFILYGLLLGAATPTAPTPARS